MNNMRLSTLGESDFIIHYDTGDIHEVSAEAFIAGVNATENFLTACIAELGEKERVKLSVKSPENGGLVEILAFSSVTLLSIIKFLESPIGRNFYFGLFGEYPESSSYHVGKLLRGIFSRSADEISKMDIQKSLKNKLLRAKHDFFSTCSYDEKIKGIGFDRSHDFPIKRNNFAHHIMPEIKNDVHEDYTIYKVFLISPLEEKRNLTWRFESALTGNTIQAYMNDSDFQNKCNNAENPFKTIKGSMDTMVVLIKKVYEIVDDKEKVKKRSVEKVYKFNDTEFETIPTDIEMEKSIKKSNNQGDLFESDNNE